MACTPTLFEQAKTALQYVINLRTTVDSIIGSTWSGYHYETRAGALMAATTGLAPVGQHVTIRNRETPGDGGGWDGIVEGVANPLYPGGGQIRPVVEITPDIFGGPTDGSADASAAFRAAIAYCQSTEQFLHGKPGSVYRIEGSVWFGTDDTAGAIRGTYGRGATVIAAVNNVPVFDFTGIANADAAPISGWKIETDTGFMPSCGMFFGRPKQAAGIRSSGVANIHDNEIRGAFSIAPIYDVSSESNTIRANQLVNSEGPWLVLSKYDVFASTYRVTVAGASGQFAPGKNVTTASGATAKILRATVGNVLWLKQISGVPALSESISDGTETGTVDPSSVINVLPAVSTPNTALGLETDTTSVLCFVTQNRGNTLLGNQLMPGVMIANFSGITFAQNNCNHANGQGTHLAITGNGEDGDSNLTNLTIRDNFFHAIHDTSVALGDPARTSSHNIIGLTIENNSSGIPQNRVKVVNDLVRISSANIESDVSVDFGEATIIEGSYLKIRSDRNNPATVTATGLAALHLTAPSNTILNAPTIASRDNIVWEMADTGRKRHPPLIGTTAINGGTVTANRRTLRLNTEGGAGTDDLDTVLLGVGPILNGHQVLLRTTSNSRVIALTESGNIRFGGAAPVLDDIHKVVRLEWDSSLGFWLVV